MTGSILALCLVIVSGCRPDNSQISKKAKPTPLATLESGDASVYEEVITSNGILLGVTLSSEENRTLDNADGIFVELENLGEEQVRAYAPDSLWSTYSLGYENLKREYVTFSPMMRASSFTTLESGDKSIGSVGVSVLLDATKQRDGWFPIELIYDDGPPNGSAMHYGEEGPSELGSFLLPSIEVRVWQGEIIEWRPAPRKEP
jgi:hypothetical protein